jgi:enoyl-CoA hydratase/carnithine racemase
MGQPRVDDDGGVRWILLDRPEIANALCLEDVSHLTDAVRGIGEDIRAIVFIGSGDRAFSAGMHLDTFHGLDPVSARRSIAQIGEFLRAVRLSPVPTIATLNGVCVGAAFELALSCDIRIAHPEVRVGLPEVKLGIPSVVDAALLPAFVGLSRARELILTGDLYRLGDIGSHLANRVVPREQLRAATVEMVARLTVPTRQAIAAQKALFEIWLNNGITASVTASIDVFGDLFADPATLAAIEAYQASTRGSRPTAEPVQLRPRCPLRP